MIFKFPTRSRPTKFKGTLDAYLSRLSNKHKYTFIISMDSDDASMNNAEMRTWLESKNTNTVKILYRYGNSKSKIEAVNADLDLVSLAHDYRVAVLLSDDMLPQIEHFDHVIMNDLNKYYSDTFGVLHYNDGKQGRKLNTLSIMGRKMFEYLGNRFYHPDYVSLWCDNEFHDISYQMNKATYIDHVIIKHEWTNYTGADELHKKNESFSHRDQITYNKRKNLGFPMESIY